MLSLPMDIKNEFDLVRALADGLQGSFNTDIAVKEFEGGYGIADLVFAKNFIQKENILQRTPINNYYALKSYLALAKNTPFSVEDIMRISGTSRTSSNNIINSLIKDGYVDKAGKQFLKTEVKLENPIKHLIAIEVKLKDWKQGILQARRYKSFTDECYLAILSNYAKNIDNSYLDKFGIGLILCNEKNGEIWIKRKAKRKQVFSFYEELTGIFAKELFLYQANGLKFQ